ERRGRDTRLASDGDAERDLVDVAPAPVLTRLERADDRVTARVRVGGRVPVRRAVATADVAAGEADPEVQPFAADAEAVLATVDRGWELANCDLVEVGAGGAHDTSAGWTARCSCTNWTAIAPSPAAAAQRLVEPERTS